MAATSMSVLTPYGRVHKNVIARPRTVLAALFVVGFYLNFTIMKMPSPLAGLVAVVLFLLNFNRINAREMAVIASFYTLAVVSLSLRVLSISSGQASEFLFEQWLSFILFSYVLFIAYSIYLEMKAWHLAALERFFHITVLIVLAGVILEVLTPFKLVSDAFRNFAYTRVWLYFNDARDIAEFGLIRPKLFAGEPSYVAIFLFFSLLAWIMSASKPRWMLFFVYSFVGLIVIRSPIVVMTAIIPMAVLLFDREKIQGSTRFWLIFATLSVIIPGTVLILQGTMMERIYAMLNGTDSSTYVRVIVPYKVMMLALQDYPLMGLGFGAKESAFPYMREVLNDAPTAYARALNVEPNGHVGHNFILLLFIQMGIIGTTAFALLLWWAFSVLCQAQKLVVAFAILILMQIFGSVNSLFFWCALFILFAVGYANQGSVARQAHVNEQTQ